VYSFLIPLNKIMNRYLYLSLRVIVAVILLQTLRFKFLAAPESVYIFSQVGMEPYGRIGVGVLELIAGILILIPKTIWSGAILSFGVISGALFMHLTQLGVVVQGDGGLLFYMALLVWVLSLIILGVERKKLPIVGSMFK